MFRVLIAYPHDNPKDNKGLSLGMGLKMEIQKQLPANQFQLAYAGDLEHAARIMEQNTPHIIIASYDMTTGENGSGQHLFEIPEGARAICEKVICVNEKSGSEAKWDAAHINQLIGFKIDDVVKGILYLASKIEAQVQPAIDLSARDLKGATTQMMAALRTGLIEVTPSEAVSDESVKWLDRWAAGTEKPELYIIMADDEPSNLALMQKSLDNALKLERIPVEQTTLIQAPDGAPALAEYEKLIREGVKSENIILLSDRQMPGMDGFELFKKLEGDKDITKIMFSGQGPGEGGDEFNVAMERALEGGVQFFKKPDDIVSLTKALGKVLHDKYFGLGHEHGR